MSADLLEAFGREEQEEWGLVEPSSPQVSRVAGNLTTRSRGNWHDRDFKEAVDEASIQKEEPLWHTDDLGNNVLFDIAGEVDDDFGDFEDVEAKTDHHLAFPATKQNQHNPVQDSPVQRSEQMYRSTLIDLLNVDDPVPHDETYLNDDTVDLKAGDQKKGLEGTMESSPAVSIPDDDAWGDFEGEADGGICQREQQVSPPIKSSAIARRIEAKEPLEDDWEPFINGDVVPNSRSTHTVRAVFAKPSSKARQQGLKTESVGSSTPTMTIPPQRPTNVPPPVILLGMLPTVFQQLEDIAMANDSASVNVGSRILAVFRVSSRIIAGRSLRWKRDTILAQSTRISQAGKGGGMKLATVNRGENQKEQREASEVVEVWTSKIPRFNNLLSRAQIKHPPLKISVVMPVRVLTVPVAGATLSPCPVCGLKRSERVSGVDNDVEDLFGEFWTEYWGHKDCLDFWYTYQNQLGQR